MSPSSSGSWSGARGADIIDLDRYMRGAVRPSRPSHQDDPTDCELVVDAGGVKARHKRFSHDSGVSDSSYSRQRRHARPHRRTSAERPRARPAAPAALDSSDSLRAFRTVCEQALLEQQRQIAHVAQLCERLTERAEKTELSDRPQDTPIAEQRDVPSCTSEQKDRRSYDERAKSAKPKSYVERPTATERRAKSSSTADSDLSSSTSQSTKDPGRKDRHRTQQCKTYKIIMSKLDELNRLFSTRSPPAAPHAPPRRRVPSSSTVTVCDKLVATEPLPEVERHIAPAPKLRSTCSPRPCSLASRRVTQAFSVDIAPPPAGVRAPNVVTESVVKCETENEDGSSSGGDPRCGFDLEDPVHLYSQAKRLQTLRATAGGGRCRARGRSAGPSVAARMSPREDVRCPRSPSLCAACRHYWRSLRDCLLPQLFSQPDHCKC